MLERYYALPTTVDRIRALWLGPAIERYATWLAERCISVARGRGCIEVLIQFNRFAPDTWRPRVEFAARTG